MSNLLKQLVKFEYKNLKGFRTEIEGIIAKSDIATGRFIVKSAPRLSFAGEILQPKELYLELAGVRPSQLAEVTAALAAFEAAAMAARPVQKVPVEASAKTKAKLAAAQAAFAKAAQGK